MDFIMSIDNSILVFIQEHLRNSFGDFFFKNITHLGDKGLIWISIAIFLLFFKKTRKCGILMATALFLGVIVGEIALKNIFQRERPFIILQYLTKNDLLIKAPSSFSFPSGHTTSSFAAATSIFICNKKYGVLALIMAALIAFSRLYLYVHYPSDVFCGIILGVSMALLSALIVNFIQKKVKLGNT